MDGKEVVIRVVIDMFSDGSSELNGTYYPNREKNIKVHHLKMLKMLWV